MADNVAATTATADAIIDSGTGYYYGARVTGDATNPARVIVYDGTDTNGTIIDELRCVASESEGDQFMHPVRILVGIYLDVTTVGRVVVWHIGAGA